jgi:glycosyltransferase involved in cell wall biosynthesis
LTPGVSHEDGVEVRRYDLFRCLGRNWGLRLLRLFPHRFWQCLTLPCNPISFGMFRDTGRTDVPFDVVHATAFPYGWPMACGLRLARRLGVPFVLTPFLHLGDPDDPHDRTRRGYLQPALRMLLEEADHLFVQTDVERHALRQVGIAETKITLQGLGVDPEECSGGDRQQVRGQWGVRPDEVVIGHLANNSREKGTVDLLQAAEQAWAAGHRFRLVLAGPEMTNFKDCWRDYRSAPRVLRLGVLDERQKREFFAGIDVFALPSRSDSFGLVLLEAWANGVPNVGYRAGGIAGVIHHEKDGLLVRCGDVPGLTAALVRLVEREALRIRFGETGRERTRHEFRWEDKLALVQETLRGLGGRREMR